MQSLHVTTELGATINQFQHNCSTMFGMVFFSTFPTYFFLSPAPALCLGWHLQRFKKTVMKKEGMY